jgi:hypothetical protein
LIVLWKRFIDDIFMLFRGSEEQCAHLVEWLNELIPGVVKFKYQYFLKKIEFLDLEIIIENGKLETNLFVKPTNLQLYLDYFSNHPNHCKESLIYSQALRIIERCSKNENAQYHLDMLKEKLQPRNYPDALIDKQVRKATNKTRESILVRKPKKKADNKVRLVLTHNRANPPLNQWIRESKKVLLKNDVAREMGENIQVGWRQPRNLRNTVCGLKKGESNKAQAHDNPGCFKCGKCRVTCPILVEGLHFSSSNTRKQYRIKHHLDCNSSFVIYLATCRKCGGQYVGKSQTKLKTRHSNHKREIKNQIGGLGHHYGGERGCGYENFSLQIIDQVEDRNVEALAHCEQYWQDQLRVFLENGGNGHCRRKEK